MTQQCLEDMEDKCKHYGVQLIECRTTMSNNVETIHDLKTKVQELKLSLGNETQLKEDFIQKYNDQTDLSLRFQREIDLLNLKLNANENSRISMKLEINEFVKVVDKQEKQLALQTAENERKNRELELITKNRDQKDKHLTILMKEKEKLHKQLDQLTGNSQQKQTTHVSVTNVAPKKEKQFSILKENLQQNSNKNSLLASISSISHADLDFSDIVSDMKKEIVMLKKELIRATATIREKEKEEEKLKKENFNLVNRCRNIAKK